MDAPKWYAIRRKGLLGWQVYRSWLNYAEALNKVYDYRGPFDTWDDMMEALAKLGESP